MPNIKILLQRLVEIYREATKDGRSSDSIKKSIDALKKVVNTKRDNGKFFYLAKDRHAFSLMEESLWHSAMVYEIALAYEYNGKWYATRPQGVPGMGSTNELHKLELPMAVWGGMKTCHVWVKTGKIYSLGD